VEAENPNANPHSSRRAGLGLVAVAGLVAVVGLAVALAHHPTTSVAPPGFTGPVVGLGFSVAYDAAADQVVVFGGLNSADTTWLWNDARWTRASPRNSPQGRSGAATAYDPMTQMVMLFGGSLAPGKSANDTWAWDGTTWLQLNSDGTRPPAGQGAAMAWDSATDEMVLVTDAETGTGTETWTWTWNGNGWTRQTRGDLSVSVFGDVMAYDPVGRALLLVSPVSPDNGNSLALSWNGSMWRPLASDGPELEGMAVDPQLKALVACGTATYSEASAVQASCWEWTTTSWLQLHQAVPLPDSRQVMIEMEVEDVNHARVLMFGWLIRAIPGSPQPLHIWWWHGGVWKLLA